MAPANVNANDTSPVPLPIDILKKKSTKRFLLFARIRKFIYECIQNTERENKVEGAGGVRIVLEVLQKSTPGTQSYFS